MTQRILVVGYKTAAMPESFLQTVQPQFSPDSRLVDKEKIKANLAEKQAAYFADAGQTVIESLLLVLVGPCSSFARIVWIYLHMP